jgi:hypothetical protein
MNTHKNQTSLLLLAILTTFLLTMNSPLSAAPDEPPQPARDQTPAALKTFEGTLKTGMRAIGGETTGIILTTPAEGVYELALKSPELKAVAEKLNGQKVLVEGIYKPRPGVEVKERRIIDVKSLTAAN